MARLIPLRSLRRASVVIIAVLLTVAFILYKFDTDSESNALFQKEIQAKHEDDGEDETEVPGQEVDPDYYEEVPLFDKLNPNDVVINHDLFYFALNGETDLTPRQACLVESSARLHPGRAVFVIFLSENITEILDSRTLSFLVSYENVFLRYIKLKDFFYHRDMKDWLLESNFHMVEDPSRVLQQALGYIFLHKFGGIILNWDYLLLRPIGSLGQFLSRCDEDLFESFPMSLENGNKLVEDLLEQFGLAFNPEDLDSTGSKLVTKRLEKHCRVHFVKELQYKECKMLSAVKILPSYTFCPIDVDHYWKDIETLQRLS